MISTYYGEILKGGLQMFVETGSTQYLKHDTSALPGGAKPMDPNHPISGSWRHLIGVELPSNDVLDDILRSFYLSVDWFMMVRLFCYICPFILYI